MIVSSNGYGKRKQKAECIEADIIMGVADEDDYKWLEEYKEFLEWEKIEYELERRGLCY